MSNPRAEVGPSPFVDAEDSGDVSVDDNDLGLDYHDVTHDSPDRQIISQPTVDHDASHS
jgi:hypothetical protein